MKRDCCSSFGQISRRVISRKKNKRWFARPNESREKPWLCCNIVKGVAASRLLLVIAEFFVRDSHTKKKCNVCEIWIIFFFFFQANLDFFLLKCDVEIRALVKSAQKNWSSFLLSSRMINQRYENKKREMNGVWAWHLGCSATHSL